MTEQDLPKVIDKSNAQVHAREKEADKANGALHEDAYAKRKGFDTKEEWKNGDNKGKTLQDQVVEDLKDWKDVVTKLTKPDASKEEIKAAQEELNDKMSPLVSEADRKIAQSISNAVLEGNSKALAEALSQVKDPERLKKFVEELNHNFKEANAGVSLAVDGKGHVLAYKDNGNTAVDIDPSTGAMTTRPISVAFDGTVTLEPGEILNGNPEKLLKKLGNTAVENINGPQIVFESFRPELGSPFRPFRPFHEGHNDPNMKEPIRFPKFDTEKPFAPSLDPLKPISFPMGPMDPLHNWKSSNEPKPDPKWLLDMTLDS